MRLQESIEKLARHGITVGPGGKLDQDRSIHLFEDGHLFDFGRGGNYYADADDLLKERPELAGAPVQAKTYKGASGAEWTAEKLAAIHRIHRERLRQLQDLGKGFLDKALVELLPMPWWKEIPECIGYDFKNQTLTVSAMDGDEVKAVCFRRSRNQVGDEIKWKTYGSKKFIPMKLTGRDEVWLASGMGELVMLELLGVDYICLQADSMVKYLPLGLEIEHLIILPDNDESFRKRIPVILQRLQPARASIVEWEHSDPREAACICETPETFILEAEKHRVEIPAPERSTYRAIDEPIPLDDYIWTMREHWINHLGQVVADGMEHNWKQFANAMNHVVMENLSGGKGTAHVIPMATGESKTQGSIVYAAMLNRSTPYRAMIVVRLNQDAFMVADQINELGGDAIAFNSDADITAEEAAEHKTVIISHETFKRHGHRGSRRWETLANSRQLFIVDEALHNVEVAIVDHHLIDQLKPVARQIGHNDMLKTLEMFEHAIDEFDGMDKEPAQHEPVRGLYNPQPMEEAVIKEVVPWFGDADLSEIDRWIITDEAQRANVAIVEDFINVIDELDPKKPVVCRARSIVQTTSEMLYRNQAKEQARKLIPLITSGVFYTRERKSLAGVEELLPGRISFAVLDATSRVNAIYDLQSIHRKDVRIVPVGQTRRYDDFTIHCLKSKTGRGSITRDEIHAILAAIPLKADDKLLIVTHKANEPHAIAWKENNGQDGIEVSVEHFGNITGRNDWRDYNKIAVIGLPHKAKEFYQALNIVKTEEALAYSEDGAGNRTIIENTDIAADLVQAIARIRIRNVKDKRGRCEPAEAYITVNKRKSLYKTVIEALNDQFPGAAIKGWQVDGLDEDAEAIGRLPKGFEATLNFLTVRLVEVGSEMDIYEPRDELQIQRDTYSRLIRSKPFLTQLNDIGIAIQERQSYDKWGRARKRPKRMFVRLMRMG
ncbi:MAG: hypothetical protein JRJ48_08330 [Deltaproteobacteria bacterium]|nr:hypothetical protein [Deltaproteobacteria bacterium]